MARKMVCFPIEIPGGKYCWFHPTNSIGTVCRQFDNEGGHNICILRLGEGYGLKDDGEGVLKPKKCLELKEIKNES